MSALPGVESAAVAHVMPLDFGGSRATVGIAGYTPAPGEEMELNFVRISPDIFVPSGCRCATAARSTRATATDSPSASS